MTTKTLRVAIAEAKRFIAAAEKCEPRTFENIQYFPGSKDSGAVKRASMDLTRALADLRRAE